MFTLLLLTALMAAEVTRYRMLRLDPKASNNEAFLCGGGVYLVTLAILGNLTGEQSQTDSRILMFAGIILLLLALCFTVPRLIDDGLSRRSKAGSGH